MVRGQTVAQPHGQIECLLVVHCFESSTHAHQYTMTGQRYLLLSDKLLVLGFMPKGNGGGLSVFYSAEDIAPRQAVQFAQPGQPARVTPSQPLQPARVAS